MPLDQNYSNLKKQVINFSISFCDQIFLFEFDVKCFKLFKQKTKLFQTQSDKPTIHRLQCC